MTNIEREDIHIISRHSNWSEDRINTVLKNSIYNDANSWQKFLRLFFMSLGVAFTTAGILFFFAYNWADLHKFIKIGLIVGLIVLSTGMVLFSRINTDIKNILLTGASVLVGVLYAVFGQIYQTGANAYDFFLGWTLSIFLWVLVSNFAPLWLVFVALINTTIVLYSQQVAQDWSDLFVILALLATNSIFLFVSLFGKRLSTAIQPPIWLTNLLTLSIVFIIVIGAMNVIFGVWTTGIVGQFVLSAIAFFAFSIWYGLKTKHSFYLATIALGSIFIIAAALVKASDEAGMFIFISLFVIASVTIVIKTLLELQKKWKH